MTGTRIESLTRSLLALALALPALPALTACDPADDGADPDAAIEADGGEGGGEGEPDPIDITGAYIDDYDIPHTITTEGWTQGIEGMLSVTAFTAVDNGARFAIGQNAADHPFAADAWSRYDWTFADGRLWYCQPSFDAADADAAAAAVQPDPSDPAVGGCGGFPWSGLSPAVAPAIVGEYTDAFDTAHAVTADGWRIGAEPEASRYTFTAVGERWAVAYNDGGNMFAPGLWSRFDWVTVDAVLYMCQSAFDAADAATARAASADPSAPPEGGCGGMFPWSALSPVE